MDWTLTQWNQVREELIDWYLASQNILGFKCAPDVIYTTLKVAANHAK